MSDYNLSGLSTRPFEQLIQALAAKMIGPNVVIFGDGPDGGREATFEGITPYPTKEQSWSGYGVVQAKFKQRSQDSQKDGEWALQQLRDELEKFIDPKRKLRKPDYYIFAGKNRSCRYRVRHGRHSGRSRPNANTRACSFQPRAAFQSASS